MMSVTAPSSARAKDGPASSASTNSAARARDDNLMGAFSGSEAGRIVGANLADGRPRRRPFSCLSCPGRGNRIPPAGASVSLHGVVFDILVGALPSGTEGGQSRTLGGVPSLRGARLNRWARHRSRVRAAYCSSILVMVLLPPTSLAENVTLSPACTVSSMPSGALY